MSVVLTQKIWRRGQIVFCEPILALFDSFIKHFNLELLNNPEVKEGEALGEELKTDIILAVASKLDELRAQEETPEEAISKSATLQLMTREFMTSFKESMRKGGCTTTITNEMYDDLQSRVNRMLTKVIFD